MRTISIMDRILFLLTAIVAGTEIVSGINQHSIGAITSYTIAFGVLVLAGVMLLLFGFELLKNPFLPIVSTLIPLMFSLGLIQDYIPRMVGTYALFLGVLYLISIWGRFKASPRMAAMILTVVHGISGLLLIVLPVVLYYGYGHSSQLLFISLGGLLIGLEGILLALQKLNITPIDLNKILSLFSGSLLISTAAFAVGLNI